jgi:hypothetical protein
MLSDLKKPIMLTVVMLNDFMLSVAAPQNSAFSNILYFLKTRAIFFRTAYNVFYANINVNMNNIIQACVYLLV